MNREQPKKGQNTRDIKGWRDWNPDQLWDTPMNPNDRRLLRVKIDDLKRQIDTLDSLWVMRLNREESIQRDMLKMVKHLDVQEIDCEVWRKRDK